MHAILAFFHVIVCALLVVVVLLQSGKGGGLAGGAFGGAGSQAVFGGRGAATFLSRATSVLAVLFMLTSLTMTMVGTSQVRKSALAAQAKEEGVAAPFTPAGTPQAPGDEGSQPAQGVMPSGDAGAGAGASPGASTPSQAPQPPATQEGATTAPPGGN